MRPARQLICLMLRTMLSWFLVLILAEPWLRARDEIRASTGRMAFAMRVAAAPRLDGTLNDPIWQRAPIVADFRQREPLETQAATEKTEVRILYDARHVYFGIHC